MNAALAKRLDAAEPLIRAQAGALEKSVYGIVDKVTDGVPHFVRRWKGTIGDMEPTDEEPTIYIAEKLEPLITTHRKYKCLFGGRMGTKSRAAFSLMVGDVNSCGSKCYVLRERMTSLKESVCAGIESTIEKLGISGFVSVPSRWEIRHRNGGLFTFGGLMNVIDMKGSFEYKYFLLEESARTSQETINTLGPTLRDVPGAELWYVWNPESANDAMSTEFIVPYQADIDRQGFYVDDYHLIININFDDNPWFWDDKTLYEEYEKDKQKVERGIMPRSRFRHMWYGEYGDHIENSIIQPDWFDACIDAHKKLGFDAIGSIVVAGDPSDNGDDPFGHVARTGVVFTDLREIQGENVNQKFDESCRLANGINCDVYGWDGIGLGAGLRDQASKHFKGKKVQAYLYKSSESPHNPESIFGEAEFYNLKKNQEGKGCPQKQEGPKYNQFCGQNAPNL